MRIWQWLRKRSRHMPRRFWLGLALFLLIGGGVFAKTYTFERKVSYEPCQVNYGETLAAWDGVGDEDWNERNFHYETKLFKIEAVAPLGIVSNVRETPPSRLSTLDCQPELEGFIDTAHSSYQWFGSRAMAARLGAPDLGDYNQNGNQETQGPVGRHAKELSPPVYAKDYDRASAWVDDGGQANLQTVNRSQYFLWCQGNIEPTNPNQSCNNVTDLQGEAARGAGYLFTEDNCPSKKSIDCTKVSSWYKPYRGLEYSKLIGRNSRGELRPFYLHLHAVSTYANRVGAAMTLTFKYPRITDVSNQINLNRTSFLAGETITATATISKIGPTINNLNIRANLADQPLKALSNFETSTAGLAAINKGESFSITARFKINNNAQAGKCYDLIFKFRAESAVEIDGSKDINVTPLKKHYCIAAPASAVYSYQVTTRGNVQSDTNQFTALASETLASAKGWLAAGASFRRVTGVGDFTLVLAASNQMTSFSTACDATYSCQVGRYVVINDERWRNATPSWNNSGGSLRDYRHMVINHETGHWLGFGHLNCPASGALAPVMQQQSISLQGCKHNPWPTAAELQSLKQRL